MASIDEKRLQAKRLYAAQLAAQSTQPDRSAEMQNIAQDFIDANRKAAEDFAVSATYGLGNALTGGYSAEAGAAVTAPFVYLGKLLKGEDASLPDEYARIRDTEKQAQNAATNQSPEASAVGMALGLGPVSKGAGLVQEGLEQSLPLAGSAVNRILAGTGAGSLTGAAWNPGEGQTRTTNALIGGVFGGTAEALLSSFRAIKQALWPSTADIKGAAAEHVFGRLNDLSGGELTPEALAAARQQAGPDAIVADLHPLLRQTVGSAIVNGADSEAVKKLVVAAKTRDPEAQAFDAIQSTLGTEKSRYVSAQEQQDNLKALGAYYNHIVEEMDRLTTIPTAAATKVVAEAFGEHPGGAKRAAANKIYDFIGTKAEGNAAIKGDLKPSDAIALKQELDGMIDGLDNDMMATTVDKGTRANLVAVRNKINDGLKNISEDYKTITSMYGGEFEQIRARTLGEKLMSNPSKQSVADLRHEYDQFSTAAQTSFMEGAGYSLFLKSQAARDNIAATSKLTGNASYREALNTVFGEAKADKLVSEANRVSNMFETNTFIDAMTGKAAQDATKTSGASPTTLYGDLATAVATAASGNMLGGAFMGSTRRTGAALTNAGRRQVDTELVGLGAAQGQDADAQLADLYKYFRQEVLGAPANAGVPVVAGQNLYPATRP